MVEVSWSESALTDIDELAGFIARASPVYAERMVADIFEHAEILTHFPKAGRKVPERMTHDTGKFRYRRFV